MFITERDVRKINSIADIVIGARADGQKCTMIGKLEDGTEFKVYHMGKENNTIRIDFKIKEEK